MPCWGSPAIGTLVVTLIRVNNKAMGEARRVLEHVPRGSTPAEEVERAGLVQAVYDKVG